MLADEIYERLVYEGTCEAMASGKVLNNSLLSRCDCSYSY